MAAHTSTEPEGLGRALGQYDVALHHWTLWARPLALAHLYMALEALGSATEATEAAERRRLGLPDRQAHALRRGLDVSQKGWREGLLTEIRREVICQGDAVTFNTARQAFNKFRHAEQHFSEFRDAAERTSVALMGYVRQGVLALLDLPEQVRDELNSKVPLDISPVQFAVYGELTGAVQDPDRLGHAVRRYPYADWEVTLDGLEQLPDGRSRMSPRNSLTTWIAEGTSLTYTAPTAHSGLTDPVLLDYRPPADTSVVANRAASTQKDGDEHQATAADLPAEQG